MTKRLDLTGLVYGELTVIRRAEGRKWLCKCSCGVVTEVASDKMRSGHTASCGHLRVSALVARSTVHGHAARRSNSSAYLSWVAMIGRCTNPTNAAWGNYGGRGITVCKRWLKFENFYVDMGARPKGTSLDRIDNAKGYTPSNCRWATRAEQARNTRSTRYISYKQTKLCVSDWAERFGIGSTTMYYWIGRYGDQEALRRLHKKYLEV